MPKLITICLPLALCLTLSTSVYAKKFPMTAATIVPGARGDVEVDKDKNGNTKLKMSVQHLARPDRLTPPKTIYIVWLQERNGTAESQGQLKVDKNLKAGFETVTPSRNFDLFVTAEQDASVKAPSGAEVLRTSIQR